jgi:hypothetical protein
MPKLRCFFLKINWQFIEHRFRSLVITIPSVFWAFLLGVAALYSITVPGKAPQIWLAENNLPSLMSLLIIWGAVALVLTVLVIAFIVLPSNSELEAIGPLFEKLTLEQRNVLRWVLPLGHSPISIPQAEKDNLEDIYQKTAFVTRHQSGHYEVNRKTASRLSLLLKCDAIQQKHWQKKAIQEKNSGTSTELADPGIIMLDPYFADVAKKDGRYIKVSDGFEGETVKAVIAPFYLKPNPNTLRWLDIRAEILFKHSDNQTMRTGDGIWHTRNATKVPLRQGETQSLIVATLSPEGRFRTYEAQYKHDPLELAIPGDNVLVNIQILGEHENKLMARHWFLRLSKKELVPAEPIQVLTTEQFNAGLLQE